MTKAIMIGGILFTEDEQLTSLDHRVEKGSQGPEPKPEPEVPGSVKPELTPMPEKDFAKGLIARWKVGRE